MHNDYLHDYFHGNGVASNSDTPHSLELGQIMAKMACEIVDIFVQVGVPMERATPIQ